jgi:hypothetical protein
VSHEPSSTPPRSNNMLKTVAATVIFGAVCAEGFMPAVHTPALALRSSQSAISHRNPLALRMQEDDYRPLIPRADLSLAPDYTKEPTQFERQGLVDDSAPRPKVYTSAMGGEDGIGGLTRRETLAVGGAVSAGLVGVLWAVTRNPGYDKKDTSRNAGNVELNKEALAKAEVKASIKDLQDNRDKLAALYAAFLADPNLNFSGDIQKNYNIVKIRTDLNNITDVFDEDTQIKTDRLVRNIIQGFVELESASKLKEGAARTTKRITATTKWFKQTESDLASFLSYFSAPVPAK